MVVGLAFTVSACAYDSPYYSSRSGYSSYSGGHYGYYDRGHYHRERYSKRPDWRAHARHRQIQRRQHAQAPRHRLESRQRFERSAEQTYELQSLMRISSAVFFL